MTYAPASLVELERYWKANGGVPLGIVGDTRHVVGYHCGRDRIYSASGQGDKDYSVQLARDKAGLTNAASAIDLGALNGSLAGLRQFSNWLVGVLRAQPTARRDYREVIYSPDGATVQRYSAIDNQIHTGAGNGDDSHLQHTHVSYLRDSESRDKVAVWRPFFEGDMADLYVGAGGRVLTNVAQGSPYFDQPNGHQVGTISAGFEAEWMASTVDKAWCLIAGLDADLNRVAGVMRYVKRGALVNPRAWPEPTPAPADCSAWESWYALAPKP